MEPETQNKLKEIKGRFRLSMNGVASRSMREKGLGYKINWGISLPELKNMAAEYGHDYGLAVALWQEDVRECKILATLVMPPDKMPDELAELWVSQISNQEMAAMASFNLFQHIDGAKTLAMRWIASGDAMRQTCGYHVLSRLMARGGSFTARDINEVVDQARAALSDGGIDLRHAVVNMLSRLDGMGDGFHEILSSAFKSFDLDIFR